jgi:hypothetical protein
MLFPQLEKYKGQTYDFDNLLNSAAKFLVSRYSTNLAKGNVKLQFDYRHFAGEANISIEYALAILELCANEKILETEYIFDCPVNDGFIESYKSLSEAPPTLECWHHDEITIHNTVDCRVQILFSFTDNILRQMKEEFAF